MMHYSIGILVGLVIVGVILWWGLGILIMLRNPPLLSRARCELRGERFEDRVAGWWAIPWMVTLVWVVLFLFDGPTDNPLDVDDSRKVGLAESRSARVDDWGDVLDDRRWNELRD